MCQMVHLFDIQTGADTWSNIGSKPIYCFSKPIYCFNKMMLHFQLFWNKRPLSSKCGHCHNIQNNCQSCQFSYLCTYFLGSLKFCSCTNEITLETAALCSPELKCSG